jgi:hypothetical protein
MEVENDFESVTESEEEDAVTKVIKTEDNVVIMIFKAKLKEEKKEG